MNRKEKVLKLLSDGSKSINFLVENICKDMTEKSFLGMRRTLRNMEKEKLVRKIFSTGDWMLSNKHPCNHTCCEKSAPVNLAIEKHRMKKEPYFDDFWSYECYNCGAVCHCDL